MSDIQEKHCTPCARGTPPLPADQVKQWQNQIHSDWQAVEGNKKIHREWNFKNFMGAMQFVNRVADVAEAEGHHPDMYIFYNLVKLDLSTHAARGLTENDFIMAAKIDALS